MVLVQLTGTFTQWDSYKKREKLEAQECQVTAM